MTFYTVTLDLPEDVYKRAERVAQTTKRPVEQIIASWVSPPPGTSDELADEIAALEQLDNDELAQIARSFMPADEVARLRELLVLQRARGLDEAEQQQAAALVEKEDWYTLHKARALYLLKKRGALPDDLRKLLDEMRHGVHSSPSAS